MCVHVCGRATSRISNPSPSHTVLQLWLIQGGGRDNQGLMTDWCVCVCVYTCGYIYAYRLIHMCYMEKLTGKDIIQSTHMHTTYNTADTLHRHEQRLGYIVSYQYYLYLFIPIYCNACLHGQASTETCFNEQRVSNIISMQKWCQSTEYKILNVYCKQPQHVQSQLSNKKNKKTLISPVLEIFMF